MKFLKLCARVVALGLLVGGLLPSCVSHTDPVTGEVTTAPDWVKLDAAGDVVAQTLASQEQSWAHRPKVAEALGNVRLAVVRLDQVVHSIAESGTVPTDMKAQLQILSDLLGTALAELDPEDDDLRAALTSLQLVVGLTIVALS